MEFLYLRVQRSFFTWYLNVMSLHINLKNTPANHTQENLLHILQEYSTW